MERRDKWMESMKTRYNTDEEGVREIMRQRQVNSRKKYKGTGGLKAMTPERRLEISKAGVLARRRNSEATTNST